MSYEVFCSGEHAYCVPMVATQSDGRRQPEIEADKLREEIKDRGFTFIEADTQIKLTCFATGEDGFEPTAEWSRITQALKERDELKRIVNEIWGMFYGQGLSVANWHQNGDLEPMEEFFEQNDWDPESCRAAHEGKEGENDD